MLAIRCCGLTKRYGRRVVVDALDLEVDEGELFGFLGPNGAGKTTTTKMLLGLVRIDTGAAWVLGSRVPCPQRLPDVGAMVEEPAFYPWLSGRRNLQIVAHEGGPLREGALEEALEVAGIAEAADRKVKGYSQGMRQRLGLAVALLRRPALLLLDEPANGLDPAGIRDLRAVLRRLAETGVTVFLSSHLLGEIEQVCDRVAIIDRGRLVSIGTVAQLGGAGEQIRVTVRPDEGQRAVAALAAVPPPARWTVTSDTEGELVVTGALGRDVNEVLVGAGIYAGALERERISLEQRFLAITEGETRHAPAAG